ncbi:uncharacterized protein J3D65DRAFT_691892 [Phyllosticta citribraziliensis]|uniref:Uncharacterized protein n=1 Tax=Phyllosticta citribraziliensis TaxID=989973 RepID=A0ABR1M384_9PEZI
MPAETTPKNRKKKPTYNKEERIEMNLNGIDTAWPNHKRGKYDGLVESTQRHIAFLARKGVPEDTVTRALNYYALQRLVKLNMDIRLRGRHNSTPFPANADSEKVKKDVKSWLSPRRQGHTALNFPPPNNGKLDPAQMTAIKREGVLIQLGQRIENVKHERRKAVEGFKESIKGYKCLAEELEALMAFFIARDTALAAALEIAD